MDLSLLPQHFSVILTVSSRHLHPYNTDDETARLIMKKILCSKGHPERFTELHGEEKREEEDRGALAEKRASQKGIEQPNQ